MLSHEQITKFQALYERRFGRKLSREEARESATKLIGLMRLIYKPVTEADQESFSKIDDYDKRTQPTTQ